jgi:hypothetical protein
MVVVERTVGASGLAGRAVQYLLQTGARQSPRSV